MLIIHDQPITIADNTEALADEEALNENSEAPVESFSYLQGADGSFDCDLEDCNGLSVSSCKVNLKGIPQIPHAKCPK